MRIFRLFAIAACILGAVFFFGHTVYLPIELIRNYRDIFNGMYVVPEVNDDVFYLFTGWAVGMMILFNLCPSHHSDHQ